jgi:hypothetical protein
MPICTTTALLIILAASAAPSPEPETRFGGGECMDGPADPWFTHVREIRPCIADALVLDLSEPQYPLWRAGRKEDVDGDGSEEYLRCEIAPMVASAGGPIDACGLKLQSTRIAGGELQVEERCVLGTLALGQYAQALAPGQDVYLFRTGLRDMDADGDMDAVCNLGWGPWDAGTFSFTAWAWIENTGFEYAFRHRADLNRDGRVSGADLGLLLGEWSAE